MKPSEMRVLADKIKTWVRPRANDFHVANLYDILADLLERFNAVEGNFVAVRPREAAGKEQKIAAYNAELGQLIRKAMAYADCDAGQAESVVSYIRNRLDTQPPTRGT